MNGNVHNNIKNIYDNYKILTVYKYYAKIWIKPKNCNYVPL